MYALAAAVDFEAPAGAAAQSCSLPDPFPLRTSRARRPALLRVIHSARQHLFPYYLLFVFQIAKGQRVCVLFRISALFMTDCDKNRHVQHIKTAEQQKTGHGKTTAVASISNFLLIHFARHLVRHSSSIFWCTAQRKSFFSMASYLLEIAPRPTTSASGQ